MKDPYKPIGFKVLGQKIFEKQFGPWIKRTAALKKKSLTTEQQRLKSLVDNLREELKKPYVPTMERQGHHVLVGKPRPIKTSWTEEKLDVLNDPEFLAVHKEALAAHKEATDYKQSLEAEFKTEAWMDMKKEEENKQDILLENKYEDPYNPFNSNYNGEPVGPDSFGGSDYGSHYMSESVEKIKADFRKMLYKAPEVPPEPILQTIDQEATKELREKIKKANQPTLMPLSYWEELNNEVEEYIRSAGDNKRIEESKLVEMARKQIQDRQAAEHITFTEVKTLPSPVRSTGSEFPVEHIAGSKGSTIFGPLREKLDYVGWADAFKRSMENHPFVPDIDPSGWIQLYSGRKFYPMDPKVEDIDIEDIAHSLSNMCRFTGHCRSFYSVAQHSVLVSHLVGPHGLYGLLHDASEAYMVDMPRPIKRLKEMQPFRDMEQKVMQVICKRFGLPEQEPFVVKEADTKMLATEARDLMGPLHPDWNQPVAPLPFKIEALPPKEAKELFLTRYRELTGENK